MSWETKTDYCGCAVTDKISVKSATENRSGQYLEKLGRDGSIKATKPFGINNASPTNDYVIEGDHAFAAGDIKLGAVKNIGGTTTGGTTTGGKNYMLSEVSGTSGAGAEPTFAAACVQVEDGAETDFYFPVPAFALSHDEVAQDAFSAFTLPEGTQQAPKNVGVELTQCNFKASCTVGLHTKNGDPRASSIHTGHVVVDLTLGQYGEQTPDVTPAEGWDVSAPLTCSDPDADFPTWTMQLTKPLAKQQVQ